MKHHLITSLLPASLLVATTLAAAPTRDTMPDTWAATDALGRTLPGAPAVRPPQRNKTVGIFYFLWLEPKSRNGLYDITKLVQENPTSPKYGPPGAFHWWGEPHFGYYVSDDEWVIRKHAQMLNDAGVEVVIFDVTNALTYDDSYLTVCRVFERMRQEGGRTPQISFIANSHSAPTVQKLYDRFYAKGLHQDLWFRWLGKPLLLTPLDGLNPAITNFFTLRHSWAWTKGHKWFGDGRDKWPWLDNHPQNPGWHSDPQKPEQISVTVAQHPVSNIGRSFHNGRQPPPEQRATDRGLCFAEQFQRALEVDPEFVFITGWNEWIAQRFISEKGGQTFLGKPTPPGGTFFVDQYNREFSRDIEPMRGGHGDNYYHQMVDGIRRYKGARPTPKATAPKTIHLDGDAAQWRDVGPEYLDDLGDTAARNHPGYGPLSSQPYMNQSGRNDFDTMKVARDPANLYFLATTRAPLSPRADATNWMVLLLDTDGNPTNGWNGYDFIVNRTIRDGARTVVARNTGGWGWEPAADAKYSNVGHELVLTIPRAALGLEAAKEPLAIGFKWADNIPDTGDILDFLDHGDVAPNGRFNYQFAE